MKRVLITIFAGAWLLGIAAAQDGASPTAGSPSSEAQTPTPAPAQTPQAEPRSTQPSAPQRVAPGSVIPVLLTKTVDAKKAKSGDEVVAKVAQDLKTNSGEVIFAKDTKVIGHVTEAQARSKEQQESQVGIAFDRAILKNGSEMPLPMSIQAIIGPQGDQNNAGGGNGDAAYPSAGANSGAGAARTGGMTGSTASAPSASPSNLPTNDAPAGASPRPQITAQTQGVLGISNLKLETAATNSAQGSVVSSEKNNVKIESGTFMLLRVNQ
jgi:hypothetical protein